MHYLCLKLVLFRYNVTFYIVPPLNKVIFIKILQKSTRFSHSVLLHWASKHPQPQFYVLRPILARIIAISGRLSPLTFPCASEMSSNLVMHCKTRATYKIIIAPRKIHPDVGLKGGGQGIGRPRISLHPAHRCVKGIDLGFK